MTWASGEHDVARDVGILPNITVFGVISLLLPPKQR